MKRRLKPKHFIPLAGLIASFLLSLAMIHYWFADLVASLLEMSKSHSFWAQVTLLSLLTVVRAWNIVHDRDMPTKMIDRLFDQDE